MTQQVTRWRNLNKRERSESYSSLARYFTGEAADRIAVGR
jgi:hypothetical protein